MEFVKVNKDLFDIMVDGEKVGKIYIDRTSEGSIRYYGISFNKEILGYGYGGNANNLKNAQRFAEVQYNKMIARIKDNPVYDEELRMYFDTEERRINFRNTPVGKNRLKSKR